VSDRQHNATSTPAPTSPRPLTDVPADTADWITPEMIERTLATFSPFYRTAQDAVDIINGVSRLIELCAE
jgi:hypothetical protein